MNKDNMQEYIEHLQRYSLQANDMLEYKDVRIHSYIRNRISKETTKKKISMIITQTLSKEGEKNYSRGEMGLLIELYLLTRIINMVRICCE